MFVLQDTVHPYTFQGVEEKVWVYLTVQRQKLRVLSGNIHFLLTQAIAVDLLNEIIHAPSHAVVIVYQGPMLPCVSSIMDLCPGSV